MTTPTHNIICMWSGAIVDIPAGWKLCDGTNGTPDLRGQFLVVAGLGYGVDDTWNPQPHNHVLDANSHSHIFLADVALVSGANFKASTAPHLIAGSTDTLDLKPPYYALCFIMKK